ncbi:hypothetical protein N431DRAFT_478862 [Stipitochalara longipes BDJ]|nr:hypothetical protein N431DRAFT_478862 [Stipitochalara longipes BDJ]
MSVYTNGTLEDWQNGGDSRSSWNILWSSLSTIFACTWTVLHMNIPPPGASKLQNLCRKLRWLLITAVAPELITSYAFGEFLQARRLLADLKTSEVGQSSWGLAHAFYLEMGSIQLQTKDGFKIPLCSSDSSDDGWQQPSLNADIVALHKKELLQYPEITKLEIQDRSKADTFAKAFALLQSSWFLLNVVGRRIQCLPISPLELSCIAYVFCTLITYMFWWHKPKDIYTTRMIPCAFSLSEMPPKIQASIINFNKSPDGKRHYRWRKLHLPETESQVLSVIRGRIPALMGLLVSLVFCCIHILAWNYTFPSNVEKILWRICNVGAAGVPIVCLAIVYIRSFAPAKFDALWAFVLALYILIISFYSFARLAVVVMLFTTLRALPARSYLTLDWEKAIPHF